MKKLFSFLAVAFALLAAISTPAQQSNSSWLTDAQRPRFETLRDSGMQALFNLDYGKARADFSQIAQEFPQHPGGHQYLASVLWIETLYKIRRLQSSLYDTRSFYTDSDEKPEPKMVEEFKSLVRKAQKISEAKLKEDPKNAEALYFLGSTEGLKASFEEAVERRHFAALKDGSNAVDHHRQVVKLNPQFIDPQITIGLYDYIVGSLPFPIRLVAGIAGAHGSKKRGLATVEKVAQEGQGVKDQAKTLLIVLYGREKRYDKAATVARELAAKFPRNYLYRLEAAEALVSEAALDRVKQKTLALSDNEREAFSIFEDLLRDKAVADTAARAMDLIHYEYAEALMKAGQYSRATDEFLAAAKVPGAEPGLATMAMLYAGRSLDASSKREQALTQYRTVLARPNVYDSHDEARRGLREPYKQEANKGTLP